jgi:hypothetical protein
MKRTAWFGLLLTAISRPIASAQQPIDNFNDSKGSAVK